MDYIELAKIGGPTVIAIVVLLLIVKEFIKFARHQEDNFNETIKNHLHQDIESRDKLVESHNRLANMIEVLHGWLKNNNK